MTAASLTEAEAIVVMRLRACGWTVTPPPAAPRLPAVAPIQTQPAATAFVLYGFAGCPWCAKLCDRLRGLGVAYEYRDVPDPAERQRLYDGWGLVGPARTMPQLFCDDERLGSYAEVSAIPPDALKALAA